MQVKQVMKTKIQSVKLGATLEEVVRILVKKKISGLLVVDEKDRLVGVISEKDVFKALYPSYQEFYLNPEIFNFEDLEKGVKEYKDKKVEELMTKDPITISPQDPIMKAGAIMIANKINRLPVIDSQGKLVGIVSRRDIYHKIIKKEYKI